MGKSQILVCFVLLLLLMAAGAAADDKEALIALDKEWGNTADTETLSQILADELIAIAPNGLATKEDQLADSAAAGDQAGSYEADQYKVVFLDDNTAVMVHHASTPDAHWSLHDWVKRDGRWQVVATSTTPTN